MMAALAGISFFGRKKKEQPVSKNDLYTQLRRRRSEPMRESMTRQPDRKYPATPGECFFGDTIADALSGHDAKIDITPESHTSFGGGDFGGGGASGSWDSGSSDSGSSDCCCGGGE